MPTHLRIVLPGLLVATVIALAATFVADQYGGPRFLYALLLGVALHFLSHDARCAPGVDFAAKALLRFGVALLGARIVMDDVVAMGSAGLCALVAAVVLTIGWGILMARVLGLPRRFGLISGAATGICGISAAMAISAALPQDSDTEQQTLVTVIGVACLSTLVMVIYPLFVKASGMDAAHAGLFLGGTVHDVAQAVGAGNIVSPAVGQTTALAKMFRVAMLVPVVLVLAVVVRHRLSVQRPTGQTGEGVERPSILPGFLVAFVVLIVVNSLGWLPAAAQNLAGVGSQWALVVSIAALGMKTTFEKIALLGWRPIALLVSETAFIAVFMAATVVHLI